MNKSGSVVPLYRIGMDDGPQDHQTVVFRDGDTQWTAAIAGQLDATANASMDGDLSLQQFMARPIRIANFTWDPTIVTPFYQSFDPWTLFFGNKRVINRINNYNNMQANLKVKIMINGNPFYYGRIMAEYFVRQLVDQVTPTASAEVNLVMASQRLKIFVDPTTNQGGELHLPMLLQSNAFSIPLSDWDEQGRIYLREVVALKHANGGTEPLSITVYAWAENVKLSIPTVTNAVDLVFQGSEYGSTPVSNVASNVSKVAGALMNIPWLAPYAKATQMISNGIGRAAFALGFSRPAQIENPTMVKRNYMGNMCNTDRADTCTRLTLDSKQELTIDPLTVGISAQDEMNISHIVQKETYLTKFTWATTAVVGNALCNIKVCPQLARNVGGAAMFNTSMATVANLFEWWRGSINFRFQIVASQYHKGRLLFVYDPAEGGVLAAEQNVQYSRIVDLSDERDFTMKVCWGQNKSYLPLLNSAIYVNQFNTTGASLTPEAHHNGFLRVYVLNDLTTPNSAINNDIQIAIYVSGGDDLEFNVMSEKIKTTGYLPLVFQGLDISTEGLQFQASSLAPVEEASETMDVLGENAPQNEIVKECVASEISIDHTNDVFFGETITSLRQLLKRYTVHTAMMLVTNPTAITDQYLNIVRDYDFPRYRGYTPDGVNLTVAAPTNIVNTTVLNYITPCYMGYRGSQRVKYHLITGNVATTNWKMAVNRTTTLPTPGNFRSFATQTIDTNDKVATAITAVPAGYTGMEVIGPDIHPVLEIELPHYSDLRFNHAKQLISPTTGDYGKHRHQLTVTYFGSVVTNSKAYITSYRSVGEDFQLFLYQGQPPLYNITV